MASSWSNKLETRLSALADGASKESIQSLAKWICFNRKHSKAFCTTLDKHLQEDSAARQWLYLQIIHEVLLLEKANSTKWERLSDTRTMLGESVVIPALQRSDNVMKARVAPLLDEWAGANAFGTPMLVNQMRKILASEIKEDGDDDAASKPAEKVAPPKVEPKTEEVSKEAPPIKEETKEEVKEDVKPKVEPVKPATSPSQPSLRRTSSMEEVTFDFEGSVSIGRVCCQYAYHSLLHHSLVTLLIAAGHSIFQSGVA